MVHVADVRYGIIVFIGGALLISAASLATIAVGIEWSKSSTGLTACEPSDTTSERLLNGPRSTYGMTISPGAANQCLENQIREVVLEGGTLEILMPANFRPKAEDEFVVFAAAKVQGQFDKHTVLSAIPGKHVKYQHDAESGDWRMANVFKRGVFDLVYNQSSVILRNYRDQ